jgi:hypothetical protein
MPDPVPKLPDRGRRQAEPIICAGDANRHLPQDAGSAANKTLSPLLPVLS